MYIIALNQMFPYVGLLGFCILTQELSLIFQQQEAGTKFYKNVIQYSRRSHIKNLYVLNLPASEFKPRNRPVKLKLFGPFIPDKSDVECSQL